MLETREVKLATQQREGIKQKYAKYLTNENLKLIYFFNSSINCVCRTNPTTCVLRRFRSKFDKDFITEKLWIKSFCQDFSWKKLKMVQDWCHRHSKPSVSSISKTGTLPFSPLLALWGNKYWPPQYVGEKVWNISEQKGLNLLQMTQFEHPRHPNPSVSSHSRVDKT